MRRVDTLCVYAWNHFEGQNINVNGPMSQDASYRTTATRQRVGVALIFAAAFTVLASASAEVPAVPPRPYVFGVFPYLTPLELENVFAPIAADFNRALRREVQFASKASYDAFAKNLLEDQAYDIAFVQPFDYVRAADHSNYLPLAARPEKLYALIVTTENSGIRTLDDLKGKRMSLPPQSAAISRLVRVFLKKNGIVPDKDVTFMYVRSHTSCLQHVLIGSTDACGTTPSAMYHLKNTALGSLRGVSETDAIPPPLFVVHSRVPESDRKRLLDAILAWPKSLDGQEIRLSGFAPITDSDYDAVRKFPAD